MSREVLLRVLGPEKVIVDPAVLEARRHDYWMLSQLDDLQGRAAAAAERVSCDHPGLVGCRRRREHLPATRRRRSCRSGSAAGSAEASSCRARP